MADHNLLVESGYRLALWIAGRWSRGRPDMADEMRQEACVALLLAAPKFDPDRPDSNWPAFMANRVRFGLLHYLTGESRRQRRFPAAPPMVYDGEETQAVEMLTVEPQAVQAVSARQVRDAVARLPERQRQVVELRYFDDGGATLEAVGEVLGVSRQRVQQVERQALRGLRAKLR